ncbi:hypothetical protein HDZ31DRAFT_32914 [Schizophyllum fasciatum]
MKFTPVLAASLAAVPAICSPKRPCDPQNYASGSSSSRAHSTQSNIDDLGGAVDTILEVATGLVSDTDSEHTPELDHETSSTSSSESEPDRSSSPVIIKDTDAERSTPRPRKSSIFVEGVPIIVVSAEDCDERSSSAPLQTPRYSPAFLMPPRIAHGI